MEDILGELGIDDIKVETTSSSGNKGNYGKKNEDKVNMYEVDFIKAKPIDTNSFNKEGKSYIIHIFEGEDDVSEVQEKLEKVVDKLSELGYVYRTAENGESELNNNIIKKDIEKEIYLPFPAFNKNVDKKEATNPNSYELPYRYAAELRGNKFNDLKKGARAIFAAKVMSLLGKTSDNPVDFAIVYSPDGKEFIRKGEDINWSKLGSCYFYLKACEKMGIPVINFKNKKSMLDFVDTYIKKDEKKEELE